MARAVQASPTRRALLRCRAMAEEDRLERAIRALEAQRADLGSSVVDTATAELRTKLAELRSLTSDERRLVTILFADVSGFTALSERTDPEEVQALLTRLWRRLDRAIGAHRGHIDKHIGDAVMAVWGLTDAGLETSADAVRAGLALQREIGLFCQEERVELSIRVGINTGLSSVSTVESTGESSIIGDAVNVASRLEHAAPLGSVLIGPVTHEHVRDLFEMGEPIPLVLKGKSEPVLARVVLGERSEAPRRLARTLRGDEAVLVGRKNDLEALARLFQQAQSGPACFALVLGEAGLGKTRVLSELALSIARSPARSDIIQIRATRDMKQTPFGLLKKVASRLVGTPEGLTGLPFVEALAMGLAATLGEEAGRDASAHLAHLLGIEVDSRLLALAHRPEQIRGRAEFLLLEHVRARTARAPIALLIDDLHYADRSSLEFLARLRDLERALIVGSVRPTHFGPDPIALLDGAVVVELKALPENDARQLARALMAPMAGVVAEPLVNLVAKQSGGNPYFARELARWLWERDFDASALSGLPPRIELLLHERLERLPLEARRVLSAAAVVGPRGTTQALAALVGREPSDDLVTLESREMLVREADGWTFHQMSLRDVAYEYTLLRDRRALHVAYARYLADHDPDSPALVARHFESGEEPVEAARFWALAGDAAGRADAPSDAIEAYELALELVEREAVTLSERPLLVRCYEGLAKARERLAEHGAALEAYERMLWAASGADDGLSMARAHNGMAWVSSQRGEHDAALVYGERGQSVAQATLRATTGARHRLAGVELAQSLHDQAWALAQLGRADLSVARAERCHSVAFEHGADVQRALALNALGFVEFALLGRFDQGTRHTEQALEIYRKVGDIWGISAMLNNLGTHASERGDRPLAARLFEEALTLARQIGDRGQEVVTLVNVGWLGVLDNQPAQAYAPLGRAISISEADGSFALSEAYRALARALSLDARLAEAISAAEKAITNAREAVSFDAGLAWRALGEALARGPGLTSQLASDPEECFAKSVSTLRELELEREQIASYEAWASYEESRGELVRARELRQSAVEIPRGTGLRPEYSTTLRLP